jgi:hypothetical protein
VVRGREEVGSKSCRFGLGVFLVQLFSLISRNGKKQPTRQKKNVQNALKNKSVTSVSASGFQICWCEGFGVGCGTVRAARMCQYHASQVRIRRESN